MMRFVPAALILAIAAAALPLSRHPGDIARAHEKQTASTGEASRRPERIDDEHLPNAYKVHPKVISGGLPEGDEGFRSLKDLGVKTVISVDGAKPDVELARKHGLRYVHLPHGYDGVPNDRALELAKAVRDLKGLVYIHCHHGKHRSPAAAAVACVTVGLLSTDEGLHVLQAAGTSKNYRGLYKSVETADKADPENLNDLKADFPETVDVPPLADAMVSLEHTHDHVKRMAVAGWKRLPKHPNLDPAHEALLLREHYTELLRTEDVMREPQRFHRLMQEGEKAAKELEVALQVLETRRDKNGGQLKTANAALSAVNNNCVACHREFRDVPLDEKRR